MVPVASPLAMAIVRDASLQSRALLIFTFTVSPLSLMLSSTIHTNCSCFLVPGHIHCVDFGRAR